MAITKQFGPSAVDFGGAVYGSAANQERYRRMLDRYGTYSDEAYKQGLLQLEREKFEFDKPLMLKEMDLKEVETWLKKSLAYFSARSDAAAMRLKERADILQAGGMQIGTMPGVSGNISGGASGSVGSNASGRSVRYLGSPAGPIATPESYSSADRAYQGNPYLSAFMPSTVGMSSAQAQMDAGAAWLAQANSRDRQRAEMSRIDQAYQAELARIDDAFGIADGWKPNLFLTGSPSGTPSA